MHYCIIDLEWNNVYAKKIRGFLNEIIEVGAVLLDENLREISRYSTFVKAQLSKKLHSSVKQLTHISNEDLRGGVVFTKAMSDFRRWMGTDETVVVTWGDGDIRTLIENYRYLNGLRIIPFMSHHVDLQKYFHRVAGLSDKNQISLANAAAHIEIDDSSFMHHRALDDSLLTAEIFKKVYDKELFGSYIKPCNTMFYSRLSFKPHYIGNISNPVVQKTLSGYVCEKCLSKPTALGEWKYSNKFFRNLLYCPSCNEYMRVGVSFKKLYDRVEIKRTSITVQDYSEKNEQDTK